jgi:hypothetical protein
MDNDLYKLKDYLKKNYNIEVIVSNRVKYTENKSINLNFLYLFISLFIIIIITYIYFFSKNNYIKLILFILFLFLIYYIHKYFMKINFYYKNDNKFENKSIKYNNIDFKTGDILQEATNWNYDYFVVLFLSIFQLDYLHNLFVIKFNNKFYGLHFIRNTLNYPELCMNFNNKHIEIFSLENYLIDNSFATKYYRVFRPNVNIDNNKVFEFLKIIDIKKLNFKFLPDINYNKDTNSYHCMSFILKLLNYINIIPRFNFQNFSSDDLEYLPELSNGKYDKSFIIKVYK